MAIYSGAKKGLLPRSVTSPYLLSGILKSGLCGGNLIIVTGHSSYGHYPQYGCSQHFNRGACTNSILIRRDWLERQLLEELQNEVLKREAVEYALRHLSSLRLSMNGSSNCARSPTSFWRAEPTLSILTCQRFGASSPSDLRTSKS